MTKFIYLLAYLGTALLFICVFVNVIQHIKHNSNQIRIETSSKKEAFRGNDSTFAGIIFGFVLIISSELLKLIYRV